MADKVEQIAGIIGDPESWKMHEVGGELVVVDVPGRPGAKQKMHKAQAIALGLWKEPEQDASGKMQAPVRNKARRMKHNKAA